MSGPLAVLTTDAPSNANLAAVRSLGRRGIPVAVCGFPGEFNLSFHSRYVTERLTLPSPTREPGGFIAALASVLERGHYPILLPTTERTAQLVSEHRGVLPAWVRVPIAAPEAIATAVDKEQTLRLAASLGVSAPRTWCPDGPEALARLTPELPRPVLVKPRQTNFLAADGRLVKAGWAVARTPDELARAYCSIHATVPRPLIQELVPGAGAGIFSIWDTGTPLGWFAHRRLREEDPRGGRASAAVSVPGDPQLVENATRLLKALNWHGVAMVEFRQDRQRDRFWLMEINGRFWGSLSLALAAGVDFPYYLYQLAAGDPVEVPASYPAGVVARDAVAELKHFVRVMRGRPRGWPGDFPGRRATLLEAPTILHPWRHAYNWTPDDPRPGRHEWLDVARRRFRPGQQPRPDPVPGARS